MNEWIGNGLILLMCDICVCGLGHFRSAAVLIYLHKKQYFARNCATEWIQI
jgi:hypothetical protein